MPLHLHSLTFRRLSKASDSVLNKTSNEHVRKRPSDSSRLVLGTLWSPGLAASQGVKPCCAANQPVREAARQQRCPMPRYQLWHAHLLPVTPTPTPLPQPGSLMPVLCTQVHAHQHNELRGRLYHFTGFSQDKMPKQILS